MSEVSRAQADLGGEKTMVVTKGWDLRESSSFPRSGELVSRGGCQAWSSCDAIAACALSSVRIGRRLSPWPGTQ